MATLGAPTLTITIKKAADTVTYGNGMRGSAPYRRALAETLVRRAALSLMEQEAE